MMRRFVLIGLLMLAGCTAVPVAPPVDEGTSPAQAASSAPRSASGAKSGRLFSSHSKAPDGLSAFFVSARECDKYLPAARQKLADDDVQASFHDSQATSTIEGMYLGKRKHSCFYVWTTATAMHGKHVSDLFAAADAATGRRLTNTLATWGSADYAKQRAAFETYLKTYE